MQPTRFAVVLTLSGIANGKMNSKYRNSTNIPYFIFFYFPKMPCPIALAQYLLEIFLDDFAVSVSFGVIH